MKLLFKFCISCEIQCYVLAVIKLVSNGRWNWTLFLLEARLEAVFRAKRIKCQSLLQWRFVIKKFVITTLIKLRNALLLVAQEYNNYQIKQLLLLINLS